MRRTCVALVVVAFLSAAVLGAGCGANSRTPAGTAGKVLDLVKSNKIAEAREYFATPGAVAVVRGAFGDQGTARVGKVTQKDPLSAAVDIYIGQNPQSPNMVFTMIKSGGQWKIMQVYFQ